MSFSPSTLALFKQLLDQTSLQASAPDFDELAAVISVARKELAAALATASDVPSQNGTAPLPSPTSG